MKILDVNQMRSLEQEAINNGVCEFELMRRAGVGAANIIEEVANELGIKSIKILVGKGNNGGDALVVAKELSKSFFVKCYLISPVENLSETSKQAMKYASEIEFEVKDSLNIFDFNSNELIVDGLLGTGFKGLLRDKYQQFIEVANKTNLPIIALDIPSGVDANNGETLSNIAINAILTITFNYPKKGHFIDNGIKYSGPLRVVPIGLKFIEDENVEAFTIFEAKKYIPVRKYNSHKNSNGRLAIISGSKEYSGAALLNANSALRSNCGMVTLFSPVIPIGVVPNALIFKKIGADCNGYFSEDVMNFISEEKFDAFCAGSGWGKFPASKVILEKLLSIEKPLILDADALNALAEIPTILTSKKNCIITPHWGEALRLAKGFNVEVSSNKKDFALALAKKMQLVVLLKGERTVAASPCGRVFINTSGTSSLATAGSGDVLSGLIGSLLAQGVPPFEAAACGAYLHGRASEVFNTNIIADDLPCLIAKCYKR